MDEQPRANLTHCFLHNMNFHSVSMETRRLGVEGPHGPPRHETNALTMYSMSSCILLFIVLPISVEFGFGLGFVFSFACGFGFLL